MKELQSVYSDIKPDDIDPRFSTIGNKWPVEFETCDLLYGIVRATKPLRVLELGTNVGLSSAALAIGLRDNARSFGGSKPFEGKLTTLDLADIKPYVYWAKIDGILPFIKFLCISSINTDFTQEYQRDYDLIFIDTIKELLDKELEIYSHVLSPTGVILVHDTLIDTHGKGLSKRETIDRWLEFRLNWRSFTFRTARGVDMIYR